MQQTKKKIAIQFIVALLLIMVPIRLSIAEDATTYNWPVIIKQLEEAHLKYPNDKKITDSLANAYNNYGIVLAKDKDWAQSESYLQKAVKIMPNSQAIKSNLSGIYFQHALDLFQNQTNISYSSYNHSEAKQLVTQALSLNANNANAYILLGDIEYSNQNMGAAQTAWQKAAALVPDNVQVQQRLAKITREAHTESSMTTKYNLYFIIKTDPEVEKLAGFDINQTLDTTRMLVSRDFNYTQTNKIPVIVYTTASYRDTVVDAPEWSEGAFDGKIRIVLTKYKNNIPLLKSTIVHEYTHAVIADLTGGNIPRWLNEGIAKYEEFKHGIPPRINVLALAYNTNQIIDWKDIDTALVSPNKSEALLAYQQSFSFVQYLVERYGMSKLSALLVTLRITPDLATAVQQIYQTPLETIQKNWQIWLVDHIHQWSEQPVISR